MWSTLATLLHLAVTIILMVDAVKHSTLESTSAEALMSCRSCLFVQSCLSS